MREALERDLRELTAEFIRMISRTQEQLALATRVMVEGLPEEAASVREDDRVVDELEVKIEEECMRIIVKHQPLATDLRLVSAILKSLTDLERIGDYAVHVADEGAALAADRPLKRYSNLTRMAARLQEMMASTARAFVEHDDQAARAAFAMDDEVDDLYEQTQRELVTYVLEDPRNISRVLALLRIGRALERIGDHLENICERVHYWLTGSRNLEAPSA
jgi:phosphate transport system protein